MIMQYDTVTILEDLNPVITKGMMGLVMDINDDFAEVMFNSETGITYSFNGSTTFTVPLTKIAVPSVA